MPAPRMLVCHICGQQFGTASLPIHTPQCEKKWLAQEALKPASERRPLPTDPHAGHALPQTRQELAAFNSRNMQTFKAESLETCTHCGRTFNDKAWQKHRQLCSASRPFRPAGTGLGKESLSLRLEPGAVAGTARKQMTIPEAPPVPSPRAAPRPVAPATPDRPPRSQAAAGASKAAAGAAKPAPQKPAAAQAKSPATAAPPMAKAPGVAGTGTASRSSGPAASSPGGGSSGPARMPRAITCFICGQGYFAKSFPIHLEQCKALWTAREEQKPVRERRPLPAEPSALGLAMAPSALDGLSATARGAELDKLNDAMFEAYNSGSLLACANCGRTFRPEALAHHSKACTPDKPMKRAGRA